MIISTPQAVPPSKLSDLSITKELSEGLYGEYISMVRRIQRDWRSGTERGNNFSVEGCVRCLVVRKKEVKMLRPLRLHKQGSTLGICAHFTNPFKAWPPDHHLFKCQDPKTLRIPPSGIPSRHYWP